MDLRAEILKAFRESGWTQQELSDKTGIPQSRISNFVTGKRKNMSLVNTGKLMKALGLMVCPSKEAK